MTDEELGAFADAVSEELLHSEDSRCIVS